MARQQLARQQGDPARILEGASDVAFPGTSVLPMLLAIAAFGGLAILSGLSLPTNHDEYQYIAAAQLFRGARLYADVFYSQTPYFPAFLSAWLQLTEGVVASPYLAARLFNIAWSLVFIAALVQLLFRLSPSRLFAVAIGAALISVEIMGLPLRVARNDMMPLALTTVALALLVLAGGPARAVRRLRTVQYLAIGVLIAAAVGTKQSYVFAAATVALHAALAPGLPMRERWTTQVLPLALGGVLGAIPMLVMVAANPGNFIYAVSEFHRTHHLWWGAPTPEIHAALTSAAVRVYVLCRTLATAPFIILGLIAAACLGAAVMRQRRPLASGDLRLWSLVVLSAVSILAAMPIFFLAIPLHPQYVAPIIPFVGMGAAASAALMARSAAVDRGADPRRWLHGASALLLASILAYGLAPPPRGVLAHLRSLAQGTAAEAEGTWAWVHTNRVGKRLNEVLGAPRPDLRIATIMNIYPLEAGFGIYPDLAGTPFFYQTNDRIPPEQVAALHGTSPTLAPDWLRRHDVRAILVGYRPELDEPFRSYARRRGFLCFTVDLRGGQADLPEARPGELWVAPELTRARPDCSGQEGR